MAYLGIKRHQFTYVVRPQIPVFRLGRKIFFERLDLDNFVAQNRTADGGPQKRTKICRDSIKEAKSGTSTRLSNVERSRWLYEQARERVTAKSRKR